MPKGQPKKPRIQGDKLPEEQIKILKSIELEIKKSSLFLKKNIKSEKSEKVESEFYYPNGSEVNVNVIFQIWSKEYKNNKDKFSASNYIKIYSVSNGGTPSTTRNKKMWNKCDFYLPTTCFGEKMKLYENFEELPQKRGYGIVILKNKDEITEVLKNTEWKDVCFMSTNGALNLRFDLIEKVLIENNFINE